LSEYRGTILWVKNNSLPIADSTEREFLKTLAKGVYV